MLQKRRSATKRESIASPIRIAVRFRMCAQSLFVSSRSVMVRVIAEVLALKHESRILRQLAHPVSEPGQFSIAKQYRA